MDDVQEEEEGIPQRGNRLLTCIGIRNRVFMVILTGSDGALL